MTVLFGYPVTSAWDQEEAQVSMRFRARGADQDVQGRLIPFDVVERYEEETTANYDITWAHWSEGGAGQGYGMSQQFMKNAADAWRDYWAHVKTYHTSKIRLEGFKFTAMGANGKAIGGSSNTLLLNSPVLGTAGSWLGPTAALAVSLRGPRKGRRGHGRFFMPGVAQSVLGGDGIIVGGITQTYADRTATLIENLNSQNTLGGIGPATDATVATVSLDRQEYADVVQVKVGDEVDHQSRRRNKRPEIYASASV